MGTFQMPGLKEKFKPSAIELPYAGMHFALQIITMLLVIGGVELNPGPSDGTRQSRLGSKGEVLDLQTEVVHY